MKFLHKYRNWLLAGVLACAVILGLAWSAAPNVLAQEGGDVGTAAIGVPNYSSPIVFGGGVVWAVNPDDDSVSLIDATSDTVVNKIIVGDEPQSITLDNSFNAYVANAGSNTVTVIQFNGNANLANAVAELTTGAEPWNIVARPDGQFVYVANSAQDTISIIRTAPPQAVVGTFNIRTSACNVGDQNRHFQPRGLAITGNSGSLFVTRFLSFTKAGGVQGDDNGKEGIVCRLTINAVTGALSNPTPITLPAQDTGFTATINNAETPTSAYPNQLQSVVICGTGANERAYLPNIAASPDGPLKFNVDTQAFVNTINTQTATSLGALNLHLGAREPEAGKKKLFFANPWAIACNNQGTNSTRAYAVSAGSDLLVRLNIAAGGVLTFTGACPTCDANTARYIDLNDPNNPATSGDNAGKNPLGIAINNLSTKAYVMNFVSRNVSVIDLNTDSVIKVIRTTDLPPPGSSEEQLQAGAEIFFSSRGHFDRPAGTTVSTDERLSSEGWQNCASCHFAGLTDGNIWIFGAGPRKAVPLNGSFNPHNPDDQRILNYSAIFDEIQDFEANIRNVSGPGNKSNGPPPVLDENHGLIFGNSINEAPAAVPPLIPIANAGRPQHTVTLPGSNTAWPALDAMTEWVRFAIRTPNGALDTNEGVSGPNGGLDAVQVAQGRRLFFQARCQNCHGGTKWTISSKDFVSPPVATEVFTEANGVPTQFLARFLSDIGSFNLGVAGGGNPIGGNVGAIEKAAAPNLASENGPNALGDDRNGDGKGEGFNIPSLLGIWQVQPYYHNGACETLECVVGNQKHRTGNNTLPDVLNTQVRRDAVVAFLKTLDAETEFPLNLYADKHDISLDPPTVFQNQTVVAGVNVSLFGTRADLQNLFSDLGLSDITVKFTLTTSAGSQTVEKPLLATNFNQDFGQSVDASGLPVITASFAIPANANFLGSLTVEVDSNGELPEDREDDNSATRFVLIRPEPPDRTPPEVTGVTITFNGDDQIATSRDVQVEIIANDPTSPSPQPTSGLSSFCIVRYAYDQIRRRWVEETCVFQPLPAPETGTDDTFIVDTRLRPREGVGYAFVWVKDGDGNISRTPGFDFISFIPGTPINLNRNDTRIFRITTATPRKFTFDPSFGDIDVSVFQGFSASAPRCDLSANNGSQNEEVTIGTAPCTGTEFQIEVEAIVNSRFTIQVEAAKGAAGNGDAPIQAAASNQPLVGGPPARKTAIDEAGGATFLPIILK